MSLHIERRLTARTLTVALLETLAACTFNPDALSDASAAQTCELTAPKRETCERSMTRSCCDTGTTRCGGEGFASWGPIADNSRRV